MQVFSEDAVFGAARMNAAPFLYCKYSVTYNVLLCFGGAKMLYLL